MAAEPTRFWVDCGWCGRKFQVWRYRLKGGKAICCSGHCAMSYRRSLESISIASIVARFWSKVDTSGKCWVWMGPRNKKGYGYFSVGRRTFSVHRWLHQFIHGPLAKGQQVLHRCANPPCIRPSHLYAGTHAENMTDRNVMGHTARGERSGKARLTDDQVRAMRADVAAGLTWVKAAAKYDVSRQTVRMVVTGRSWKHVA